MSWKKLQFASNFNSIWNSVAENFARECESIHRHQPNLKPLAFLRGGEGSQLFEGISIK